MILLAKTGLTNHRQYSKHKLSYYIISIFQNHKSTLFLKTTEKVEIIDNTGEATNLQTI